MKIQNMTQSVSSCHKDLKDQLQANKENFEFKVVEDLEGVETINNQSLRITDELMKQREGLLVKSKASALQDITQVVSHLTKDKLH